MKYCSSCKKETESIYVASEECCECYIGQRSPGTNVDATEVRINAVMGSHSTSAEKVDEMKQLALQLAAKLDFIERNE